MWSSDGMAFYCEKWNNMADSPFLSFVDKLLDLFDASADVLHFGSWNERKDHEYTVPDFNQTSVILINTNISIHPNFRYKIIPIFLTQLRGTLT